jgi:hypothetical protein
MWPFRKKPNVVTREELAARVMELMRRCGASFCAELQKQAEETWSLSPEEITTLGHEIFLAHLWAASNALESDRTVLDSLHDGYFESCYHSAGSHEEGVVRANAAQAEVFERYEIYHKAWEKCVKSNGTSYALGFEMSQFFFPRRRPVRNFKFHSSIQIDIQIFMKSLIEFRKECELKEDPAMINMGKHK